MPSRRLIPRLIPLAVAAALSLPAATADAASLPAGTTAILSGTPSLDGALGSPVSYSSSTSESVSQNGRYVAFESSSDGLVDGDDDRVLNVYVKDRATGSVTHVSKRSGVNGEPSHDTCEDPAISDDGSRVAFTCRAALDPADDNGVDDVYVRDLGSATTFLVSRQAGNGPVGESSSRYPSINANGEYVAFSSDASRNLHPDAKNGGELLFRRHIGGANEIDIASRTDSAYGNKPIVGKDASISDDGQKVAFTSFNYPTADPLDTNSYSDVYVRDISASKTVLASRAPLAGPVGNGHSDSPALAGDGQSVAFRSQASNFDPAEDTDHEPDVYWRSLAGAANQQNTTLVSINAAGDKSNADDPSIDDSGNVIGFVARDSLIPADDNATADAYVKDISVNNTLSLVSRGDGDAGPVGALDAARVSLSGDGTKAVSTTSGRIAPGADPRRSTVILRDLAASPKRTSLVARPAGDEPFVNQGGYAGSAALSADGRYTAFVTDSAGLLPENAERGVVVRDRVTGGIVLASRADGPDGAPLPENGQKPAISADGRRVAFAVTGSHSERGVWVRDIVENRTYLVSRADGEQGAAGNGQSEDPSLDADGSRVSFVTQATNLGDGDTDDARDVHLRDLERNQTLLVSRADGLTGAKGNGPSTGADLSADGFRAAFVSSASNLGDGDTDTQADVHLRDLAAQTTRLVSAGPDGKPSDGPDFSVSIDASGTRVAFGSGASDLGVPPQTTQVFVRDLTASTLTLASRADGADGAPADNYLNGAMISPDGGFVAFTVKASNLSPGAPLVAQAYVRDLAAGRTELVSRRTSGEPATRGVNGEDISRGGGCVAFRAGDAFYGPESDHGQLYLRVVRADCGDGGAVDAGGGNAGDGPKDGGGGADTIAPVLSRAKLSPARFRVARAATPRAAGLRRGSVLRFRSTEAGSLQVKLERAVPKRKFRRAATLTRRIRAGNGKVALSGRIGRKRMAAGKYRATLVATDAAGNRSKPVRVKFTIVKG